MPELLIASSTTSSTQNALQRLNTETWALSSTSSSFLSNGIGVNHVLPMEIPNFYEPGQTEQTSSCHILSNAEMAYFIQSGSQQWKVNLPVLNNSAVSCWGSCEEVCLVIAGHGSGHLTIWNMFGQLLSQFQAHYRAVTCIKFVNKSFVVTSGEDGIVHFWRVSDLVSDKAKQSNTQPEAVRSVHEHTLSVTDLKILPGNRVVSCGLDRLCVILEASSGEVIGRIVFPSSIKCMDVDFRLFVGCGDGSIYYAALERTTLENSPVPIKLSGHTHPVSYLYILNDNQLVSGDSAGQLRVWNLKGNVCLKCLKPWSHGSISSILPLPVIGNTNKVAKGSKKKQSSLLMQPLRKFNDADGSDNVLIWSNCKYDVASTIHFDVSSDDNDDDYDNDEEILCKMQVDNDTTDKQQSHAEMEELKQKLAEADDKVKRWEKINQKLLLRLQQGS